MAASSEIYDRHHFQNHIILSIDQQEGFWSQTDDGDIPKWKVGTGGKVSHQLQPRAPIFPPTPTVTMNSRRIRWDLGCDPLLAKGADP